MFKIRFSTLKILFGIGLSLVFLIFVATPLLQTDRPVFIRLVGVLNGFLFGGLFIVSLLKLFDPRPCLIFNSEGLIDRRLLKTAIPWKQVDKIEIDKTKTGKAHRLKLELSKPLTKKNFKLLYRATHPRLRKGKTMTFLNLDLSLLSNPEADILAAKAHFLKS